MSDKIDKMAAGDRPDAKALRMLMLEKQLEDAQRRQKQQEAEQKKRDALIDSLLKTELSAEELAVIRRLVLHAVTEGKMETLVYTFPSELCSDGGRAINNGDPNWTSTLQGKAQALYQRYKEVAEPDGYKLKAMIMSYPGGMPGDIGFFLSWAPEVR